VSHAGVYVTRRRSELVENTKIDVILPEEIKADNLGPPNYVDLF
jgi:hypothetical protein